MYSDQIQTQLQLQIQTQGIHSEPHSREHAQRMQGALTELALHHENALYARTRGISQVNRAFGWRPGYLNRATGEIQLSRFGDGRPAPIHVLDGLPESWVKSRNAEGHVIAAESEIISGFIREGRFFTREQAARSVTH